MSGRSRTQLDVIVEKMTPKPKKRIITKERIVAVAGAASHLLGLVVAKRPQFAPLQLALASLLQPVEGEAEVVQRQDVDRLLMQIKKVKDQLRTSTDDDTQRKAEAKLEALYGLLTDDE